MSVQEQAMQMISGLSDDNVIYLIDFMKRFMIPKDESDNKVSVIENTDDTDFMREMENMRIKTKSYFPVGFDSDRIWEEAMNEKYGSIN